MSEKNDTWKNITTSLQSHISRSDYKTWFSQTYLKKLDQKSAIIEVPNKFVASWIRDNYVNEIQTYIKDNLNLLPEIRFTYIKAKTSQLSPKYETIKASSSVSLTYFNPSYAFNNFVTANSNRYAYNLALQAANKPPDHYNPLYLFSKLGLGKTHLLNAIGLHLLSNNSSINVKYLSIDRFSTEFSLAKKNRKLSEFRKNYRNLDFIMFDDIHLISGRKKSQEELIFLFNLFYESRKQIVVAGTKPPNQISKLLPQLRSRLEWGILSEIHPPNQKTKIKIIEKKAKEENLHIPDDVIFFLANTTNNIKTLTQHIISLQTYSSLYQREIDISIVKSVIKNSFLSKTNIYDIQKVTADHFSISLSELISNKKSREFSYPRHIAMYLCRNLTYLPYKKIGEAFGNKNHTTVIHAIKHIEKDKKLKKKSVMEDINKLNSLLS